MSANRFLNVKRGPSCFLREEAIRTFIAVRTAEKRAERYSDRFRVLEKKLSAVRLRRSPTKILREDRDRI
jgi:hypothetical protein